MHEALNLFTLAGAKASHAQSRLSVTAANLANADTPGYQARDTVSFTDMLRNPPAPGTLRTTRAGHIAEPVTAPRGGIRAQVVPGDELSEREYRLDRNRDDEGQRHQAGPCHCPRRLSRRDGHAAHRPRPKVESQS